MRKKNKTMAAIILMLFMMALAGCASVQSGIHDLHGSIIGNEYYIDTFDNTGIRTLRTHGKKIDIDNNIVEEKKDPEFRDHYHNRWQAAYFLWRYLHFLRHTAYSGA